MAPAPATISGDLRDLPLAFHAAWAGHHHHALAADLDIADLDDRALRTEIPAGQLVRRSDPDGFLYAVHHLENLQIEFVLPAYAAQNCVHDAGGAVHVEPQLHQPIDDRLDLRLAGALLHHD